jgi:restriction endonuclease S subunit
MELVAEKYKQTEVGLIPSDWEVKRLDQIANIIMGQSPQSEFYNTKGDGLPLIQGNADVENRETIVRSYTSVITKRGKIGDIIMSVRAPVGEVSKATFDCCLGRGVCAISYQNEYLYQYLIYLENSWAQLSTGSTFDSVNSKQVKELKIPIPKAVEEQTAIATALSDADALITSLEKLIAKKRLIKQGAMQELLKPKEGWENKSIKEISIDMLQGVNTAIDIPEYVHDGIPILKANNIIDGEVNLQTSDHISQNTFKGYSDRFKIKKNDFLFSNIGARLGTGSLMKKDIECSFAWNVMRIIPNTKLVLPEYLNCIMNSPVLFNEIKKNESGSGMGFVPKNVIQNITLPIPPTNEEQTRIATIFSDMDAEITALETKLEKYRKIKLGMMQQLLTGKIRLV